jgi:hypothetical protein
VREVSAQEVRVAEIGVSKGREGEARAGEIRGAEGGAGEVRAAEVDAAEVGAREFSAGEISAREVSVAEITPSRRGSPTRQVGTCDPCAGSPHHIESRADADRGIFGVPAGAGGSDACETAEAV